MESQNWDSIKGGVFNQYTSTVLVDSIHNKLLVSAKLSARTGSLYTRGLSSWDGTKWDSLSGGFNTHDIIFNPEHPNGMLLTCTPLNGKLLVGGYFTSIGWVNTTGLALWDGLKWDSLPKRAFRYGKSLVVNDFAKKDSLLYLTGNFDTIASQKATGLATWNGSYFKAITLPISSSFQTLTAIKVYKNELYVSGYGFIVGSLTNAADVFKFDGTNWVSTTGTGLYGGVRGIGDLEIYNDTLYASGSFTQADGNIANHIMKWDGTNWHDVGFGDQIEYFIGIDKMLVYKNKLWAFGRFTKASGKMADRVAIYDGTKWSGLCSVFDNNILSATIFNDTIYIAGGFTNCNGDNNIRYIAKLKNPNVFNNCDSIIPPLLINEPDFAIYPNPTLSILQIHSNQFDFQNSKIIITNTLGQIVFSVNYMPQIDISSLSAGMYYLTMQDGVNTKTVKIIKE